MSNAREHQNAIGEAIISNLQALSELLRVRSKMPQTGVVFEAPNDELVWAINYAGFNGCKVSDMVEKSFPKRYPLAIGTPLDVHLRWHASLGFHGQELALLIDKVLKDNPPGHDPNFAQDIRMGKKSFDEFYKETL